MSKTIMKVYEPFFKDIKIDKELKTKLDFFNRRWEAKSNHLSWLTSGYIGVEPIVFSVVDEHDLFIEIFKTDMSVVRKEYLKLDVINASWRVHSNHKAMFLIVLMVKIRQSKLPVEFQNEFIKTVYSIYFYMKMSSLITGSTRFLNRQASPELAQAVYENLSNHFLIKRFGTWVKVRDYIATDFYPRKFRHNYKNGINADRLTNPTDENLLEVTMQMSTRLTKMINNIFEVYNDVEQKGMSGSTSTLLEEFDGETNIRDITNDSKHVFYLKEIISDKENFVKKRLVVGISDIISASYAEETIVTLNYMSENYLNNFKAINSVLEDSITFGVEYLNRRGYQLESLTDIIEDVINTMFAKLRVGKEQGELITRMKSNVSTFVNTATNRKTNNLLTGTTITLIIYLFVRAISRNKVL